ncbi:MAG TPA: amidohydrolase family protein [Nitrososphaerales archaeon]|nr:amidohydrolase family protein [Nitrososphaerales archaeon]
MKLILRDAQVLDGKGGRIDRTSLVVKGSEIAEITSSPSASTDDTVVDCGGCTILPGLIDMHVHPGLPNIQATPGYFALMFQKNALRMLHAGFTSIRCLGSPYHVDLDAKRAAADGFITQPRIFAAGMGLCVTNGHLHRLNLGVEVDGVDAFRAAARGLIKRQVDWLKISADALTSYSLARVDEMKAAVEVFHGAGKRVAIHAGTVEGIKNSLEARADTIEHGFFLAEDPKLIRQMLDKGVYYVPTLYIHERWDTTKDTRYGEAVLDYVRQAQRIHPKSFRMALEAGVKIAMGSDEGGVPGSPIGEAAYELELMVKYGMKPMEAIVSATGTAAEALGVSDLIGSIREGMQADLLIIDKDPSSDISVLSDKKNLRKIILAGNIVEDHSQSKE